MKLKKLSKDELNTVAAIIDNEGAFYAISYGGWLKPENYLETPIDAKRVREAIEIVEEYIDLFPKL